MKNHAGPLCLALAVMSTLTFCLWPVSMAALALALVFGAVSIRSGSAYATIGLTWAVLMLFGWAWVITLTA